MRTDSSSNKKSPWTHISESANRETNMWSHGVKRLKMMRPHDIWREAFVVPGGYIPAVILGLLLNLLDAISYGKIALSVNVFETLCFITPLIGHFHS